MYAEMEQGDRFDRVAREFVVTNLKKIRMLNECRQWHIVDVLYALQHIRKLICAEFPQCWLAGGMTFFGQVSLGPLTFERSWVKHLSRPEVL